MGAECKAGFRACLIQGGHKLTLHFGFGRNSVQQLANSGRGTFGGCWCREIWRMAVEGRGGGGVRGGGWVGVGDDGAMDDAKYMPCLERGRVLPTSRQGADFCFRGASRRVASLSFLKTSI